MKAYKKRHQKLLHYCLTKRTLSEQSFSVLTSLTETESQQWLSSSLGQVRTAVTTLGLMAQYQRHRLNKEGAALLKIRQSLTQHLYLWSDTAGLTQIPSGVSAAQLGLIMLAQYDTRMAVIWATRLGAELPSERLSFQSKHRLRDVIRQVLTPLNLKSDLDARNQTGLKKNEKSGD
ncbi:hypothetical protein ACODM8_17715 [Vibrio ostreicida]|uniref:Transcriptional regulator n=1 Tax=Vibrio ostreicida TaxID=526588 RepID=A0ABT8C111_9VIBR|nr:hypothetical protein [Vibrio ostreicida]MDN3612040.1 hypothetical protein [Vibrio ostreicida]NPD08787.1 hypothetical protein [Vibrio ostreicida]